jgi:hypothetical protein
MTTSTPTPGMWLRVTPDGNAVLVEVDEAPFLGWFDYKADKGGWIADDHEGTLYYPISKELLEAAAAMADAPVYSCYNCDNREVDITQAAYLAAVEKAVKG